MLGKVHMKLFHQTEGTIRDLWVSCVNCWRKRDLLNNEQKSQNYFSTFITWCKMICNIKNTMKISLWLTKATKLSIYRYLVQLSLIGPSTFDEIKKHSDVKFRVLINQGNKTKQWRPNILVKSLHLFYLQVLGPAIAYWTKYVWWDKKALWWKI